MKLLLEYQQNPGHRTANDTLQQAENVAREVYNNERVRHITFGVKKKTRGIVFGFRRVPSTMYLRKFVTPPTDNTFYGSFGGLCMLFACCSHVV